MIIYNPVDILTNKSISLWQLEPCVSSMKRHFFVFYTFVLVALFGGIYGTKKITTTISKVLRVSSSLLIQPFVGRNYHPVIQLPQRLSSETTKVSSPKFTFPKSVIQKSPSAIGQGSNRQNRIQAPTSTHFVRDAVQSVGPSVVRIDCEREVTQIMTLFNDNFREGDTIKVAGTGFVVSSDGYILTNAHVVENAKKVTFQLSNGRTFKAKVVESDEFTDLAVLKADLSQEKDLKLTTAPLGDSSRLHAGDWVIAMGCPVGLDFTVTLGVVSSPKRSASEVGATHLKGTYIQTDAALNSGNSGGPLVNDQGEVIGINTMVRTNTEAIGFAIPINRARAIYEVLREGRKPNHAYFGIELNTVTPDVAKINNEDPNAPHIPVTLGALILRVKPGSPADVAGIRRYDVILRINDAPVKSADEAEMLLDLCKPGRSSIIVVGRGELCTSVELTVKPADLHQMLQERKKLLPPPPVVVVKPGP